MQSIKRRTARSVSIRLVWTGVFQKRIASGSAKHWCIASASSGRNWRRRRRGVTRVGNGSGAWAMTGEVYPDSRLLVRPAWRFPIARRRDMTCQKARLRRIRRTESQDFAAVGGPARGRKHDSPGDASRTPAHWVSCWSACRPRSPSPKALKCNRASPSSGTRRMPRAVIMPGMSNLAHCEPGPAAVILDFKTKTQFSCVDPEAVDIRWAIRPDAKPGPPIPPTEINWRPECWKAPLDIDVGPNATILAPQYSQTPPPNVLHDHERDHPIRLRRSRP